MDCFFKCKIKKKNRGVAIIEFFLFFFIFVFSLALLYGSWGVVHSGVLNSIGARAYAFYSIANRSDLSFYRDDVDPLAGNTPTAYFWDSDPKKKDTRFFAVIKTEGQGDPLDFFARQIKINLGSGSWKANNPDGIWGGKKGRNSPYGGGFQNPDKWLNDPRLQHDKRNIQEESTVVYLKQGYGICLDVNCGKN